MQLCKMKSGLLFVSLATIFLSADAERGQGSFDNRERIVTVIQQEPFLMVNNNLTGNARYSGFIVDLVNRISKRVGFRYTITEVKDGKFGALEKGAWTGMVGELARKEADIAAAPMTVTAQRARVVDFTSPFMSFGIALMVNTDDVMPSLVPRRSIRPFFMEPFSLNVWAFLLVATIIVAILFYLVNRFNPYEIIHKGNEPGDHDNCGVLGALWITCGGLVLQGFSRRPRSATSFILILTWWIVSLILFATYISGMFNYQSGSRAPVLPKFTSLEDISKQTYFRVGAVKNSPTWDFFCKSRVSMYTRLCGQMKDGVKDFQDGVQKVREGNFAFFETSTLVQYEMARSCNSLTRFGDNLNQAYFALATPLGSDIADHMELAILEANENGDLHKLEQKWWYGRSDPCQENSRKSKDYRIKSAGPGKINVVQTTDGALNAGDVCSLFIFLLVGVCLAAGTMAIEVVCHRRRKQRSNTKEESKVVECDEPKASSNEEEQTTPIVEDKA